MNFKKFITICKCIDMMKSAGSANMLMMQRQTMSPMLFYFNEQHFPCIRIMWLPRCSSSAFGLSQFVEVIVSSLSLCSVCMAVTSATLNGEINYHWCHLSWHRSQFDHVNQMKGPLDIPVLCNHALMERIKMHLGHLTVFIRYNCH